MDDQYGWFTRRLVKWGKRNFIDFPWRRNETPLYQLIAEVLLQRTRAEQVVPVFLWLVETYPTIEDLAGVSLNSIRRIIKPLGLHWRAPLLHKLIREISSKHKGNVPESLSELVKLPAVGSYAASAFLSLHRNKRSPIVDSNVVRVYGRFFGFHYNGETRRKRWLLELAEQLTPVRGFRVFNYAILDLARLICKRHPTCEGCPLTLRCVFSDSAEASHAKFNFDR